MGEKEREKGREIERNTDTDKLTQKLSCRTIVHPAI